MVKGKVIFEDEEKIKINHNLCFEFLMNFTDY